MARYRKLCVLRCIKRPWKIVKVLVTVQLFALMFTWITVEKVMDNFTRTELESKPSLYSILETRRKHVEKMCSNLNLSLNPPENPLKPNLPNYKLKKYASIKLVQQANRYQNILVDDKHKLLYCTLPKVASTNWHNILAVLSGTVNITQLSKINTVSGRVSGERLKSLADFNATERQRRIETYFKFMFVRAPHERLLSVWRNKFLLPKNEYFYNNFGRHIVNRYRAKTNPPVSLSKLSYQKPVKPLVKSRFNKQVGQPSQIPIKKPEPLETISPKKSELFASVTNPAKLFEITPIQIPAETMIKPADEETRFKRRAEPVVKPQAKPHPNSPNTQIKPKALIKPKPRPMYVYNKGNDVTFSEFLQFVVDPNSGKVLDEHWNRYNTLCLPCELHYDIIGKYETFQKDVDFVLGRIGAEEIKHFPEPCSSNRVDCRLAKTNVSQTHKFIRSSYANISSGLIDKLYNFYKTDYLTYGYEYPDLK